MYKNIFSPAIALLNRLNYTQKFTLLWLMSLVAIAVMVYSLFASLERVIQPSQRQLQGLALIKPISRLAQLTQLHRGLSAASLGGNEAMGAKRVARGSEVAEAFKAVEDILPPALASSEDFMQIKKNWAVLRKEGLHWAADENFAAHTRLVEQIQFFKLFVADEYLLIMDPEIATFYLVDTAVNKLPHTLESLGKLRAYGTVILTRKQITENQKTKLNVLIAELDSAHKEFNANLEKTARHNPALRNPLLAVLNDNSNSVRQITGVVTADILAGRFATPPDVFLDMSTVEIDKVYAQLHEVLLPTAEALIKARISQAKNTLLIYVSGAMLLFIVGVYFSVSIYYAIIGSIQSLVHSLRSFADGNLGVRVNLNTRDELSQVGESFNEMAHEFSDLLQTHREDEMRLRATIETAMDAVVQMDAAGIIIGWTSQAEKIFGWSRSEAIGRALNETIIPSRYREAHVKSLKRFLLTGEGLMLNSRIETTALHCDGHEFPVELSIAPIKVTGQTGGAYEFSAFIRDITEFKRLEQELRIAAVAFDAQQGIAITDEKGVIVRVNHTFTTITGYSAEEVIGNTHRMLKSDRQDDGFYHRMWENLQSNKFWQGEIWNKRKNGEIYPEWLTITAVVAEDGKINNYVAIFFDITERKQAEAEVATTTDRLAALIDAIPDAIVFKDGEGRWLIANEPARQLFCLQDIPWQGKTATELAELLPEFGETYLSSQVSDDKAWADGRLSLFEEKLAGAKGGLRSFESRKVPTFNKDGKRNGLVIVERDVSERQQVLERLQNTAWELEVANARIEEERAQLANRVAERTAQLLYANHTKDSFLATMSHEIRTPLGGLLGMMELLSLSRLDDWQREMLQAARDSGGSLLRIVDDILDWSKIGAGKLELAPQAASIPEMLGKVVGTYAQLASMKGLTLRQQVDSRLSAAHLFDPLRLSQILNNFTSNAIKFTKQGMVEISAGLVAQFDGGEKVRFCVKDTGIGIDMEQQARLFKHYEQASADTARMYGGTGLGLAICRSLAELMGGTINVESKPGSGSTFCLTVSLPVASQAAQRDFKLMQAWEGSSWNAPDLTPLVKDGKQVSVLLVDDHPVNRELLMQQLELLGACAEVAESGATALSLYSSGSFDMVITDCHMPEMDGYELSRTIREMEQHDGRQRVPIIAWTANVLTEEEERCRAAGMDDMLTKPMSLSDLRNMLLKWLAKANISTQEEAHVKMISTETAQNKSVADMPIDFSVLKKIAMSHAVQVEMLREFNLHNRIDIANMNAALKDNNPTAVARIAHRIKGASRMVGALDLEGICTAIEKAASQGDMNGARRAADATLDTAIERIEALISKFISEN